MQPVPPGDAAYSQLRQLNSFGFLAERQDHFLDEINQHPLTHYDIAFMLVEPFERCTALVEAQDLSTTLPEQRRRADIACFTFSKLSSNEIDTALDLMSQLLKTFGNDIDQLSPGLNHRAGEAIKKLSSKDFQPWQKSDNNNNNSPTIHLVLAPSTPNSISDPWLFLSPLRNGTSALSLRAPGSTETNSFSASKLASMSSLTAAADLAFGRFRFYGTISTLPGEDPTNVILRPDGTGKAMLGIEIGLMRVKEVGISGIFEYHIARPGDSTNINTGTVGGIGLSW